MDFALIQLLRDSGRSSLVVMAVTVHSKSIWYCPTAFGSPGKGALRLVRAVTRASAEGVNRTQYLELDRNCGNKCPHSGVHANPAKVWFGYIEINRHACEWIHANPAHIECRSVESFEETWTDTVERPQLDLRGALTIALPSP